MCLVKILILIVTYKIFAEFKKNFTILQEIFDKNVLQTELVKKVTSS